MNRNADFRTQYLQNLPAAGKIIQRPEVKEILEKHPRSLVMQAINDTKSELRDSIFKSESEEELKKNDFSDEGVIAEVIKRVSKLERRSLRRAINATGIVLSTNLGRATLSESAQEALRNVASGYSTLAVDMETGDRGSRDVHVQKLLTMLTGAEDATVANNNAAATMLILHALADGKEVIVSRGQLIEIGGAFQLPEVVHRSGAKLVEVGTTNKTHLRSYREAITEDTGAILRVHQSNYRMIGFTQDVPIEELVELGREYDIPVVDDLGSGAFVDLTQYGLPEEPVVSDSVKAGADIVCFSGDKLLSGPQSGIIIGKKKYIQMIKKNPLARILRVGKLTLAALEGTLRLFLNIDKITQTNPTLRLLTLTLNEIEANGQTLVDKLSESLKDKAIVELIDGYSLVGGGSLPGENLPTKLVSVKPLSMSAETLGINLRMENEPPVFTRIQRECVLLDMRTVLDDEMGTLAEAVEDCC